MAWDANSREVLESFFSSLTYCEKNCNYCSEQLVTEIPLLEDSTKEKINRIYDVDRLFELVKSIDLTIENFEFILNEPDLKMKLKMLEQPFELCFQYEGNHDLCVYEKHCKEKFSPEEPDKFLKEGIDYCKLINTYIFQRLDSWGFEEHTKPGGPQITSEKKELILEAHEKGMSISKAVEYTGVSQPTVKKYWKKSNLKIPIHKISEEKEQKLLEAYEKKMTVKEAAEYAGVGEVTVRRHWKSCGVEFSSYRISEEKEQKLLEAHKKGMNTSEAAEYADVCYNTTKKYWKNLDLEAPSRIPEEKERKILEAYEKGMAITDASKYADVGWSTIKKYWNKHGLDITSRKIHKQYNKISEEKEQKILEAHEKGMNVTKAVEYTGVNRSTVREHWKKLGLELHVPYRISEEKEQKILEAHEKEMSVSKAAEYAGVGRNAVSKRWKAYGFEILSCVIPEEKEQKILEAHEKGMSVSKAAEYADVSCSTVKRHWKKLV